MFTKNVAALITGPHYHLIDHLAPLAIKYDFPLIVAEQKVSDLCKIYYPDTKTIYVPYNQLTLRYLSDYDVLISSTFWKPLQKKLLQMLFSKDVFLAYLPHGNSDKGHIKPLLDPYVLQDHVFLYGSQMIDHLKKRNVFKDLKSYSIIGNHRFGYYQKNKKFLDEIAYQKVFSHLDPNNKTLLYAPTWNDYENLGSFSSASQALVDQLPSNLNLIIKPHPLIKERSINEYVSLSLNKKNVFLLEEFPPIYPLLSKVDGYIGDFSSVGYDFLYFQKPMFFIDKNNREKQDPTCTLFTCGKQLDFSSSIYSQIIPFLSHWQAELKKKQKALYSFAFSSKPVISLSYQGFPYTEKK